VSTINSKDKIIGNEISGTLGVAEGVEAKGDVGVGLNEEGFGVGC
jgi:hypothetical protein